MRDLLFRSICPTPIQPRAAASPRRMRASTVTTSCRRAALTASWAQNRAIAKPLQADIDTSPARFVYLHAVRSTDPLVAGDDQGRGRCGTAPPATAASRRCLPPILPWSLDGLGEHQLTTTSEPPAVDELALLHLARPWRRSRNTTISHSRSEAASSSSISKRRCTRARSNRIVSCGSQAEMRACLGLQREY